MDMHLRASFFYSTVEKFARVRGVADHLACESSWLIAQNAFQMPTHSLTCMSQSAHKSGLCTMDQPAATLEAADKPRHFASGQTVCPESLTHRQALTPQVYNAGQGLRRTIPQLACLGPAAEFARILPEYAPVWSSKSLPRVQPAVEKATSKTNRYYLEQLDLASFYHDAANYDDLRKAGGEKNCACVESTYTHTPTALPFLCAQKLPVRMMKMSCFRKTSASTSMLLYF